MKVLLSIALKLPTSLLRIFPKGFNFYNTSNKFVIRFYSHTKSVFDSRRTGQIPLFHPSRRSRSSSSTIISLSLTRLQFSIQWPACAHPRPIINRIHSPGFYTCGDATSSDSAQYTRMAKTQRLYYRNNEARSPFITIDNEFDIGGHPFLFRNPAGFSAVELGAGKRGKKEEEEEKKRRNLWPLWITAGQVEGVEEKGTVMAEEDLYRAWCTRIHKDYPSFNVSSRWKIYSYTFLNNRAVLPCAHKMAGREEKRRSSPSSFPSSKALKGDINRGTRREPLIKYM